MSADLDPDLRGFLRNLKTQVEQEKIDKMNHNSAIFIPNLGLGYINQRAIQHVDDRNVAEFCIKVPKANLILAKTTTNEADRTLEITYTMPTLPNQIYDLITIPSPFSDSIFSWIREQKNAFLRHVDYKTPKAIKVFCGCMKTDEGANIFPYFFTASLGDSVPKNIEIINYNKHDGRLVIFEI